MNRYRFFLSATLAIILIISGCAPVYIPNTTNAPLFSNRGELLVAGFGGTNGYDAQFAYAITDHVAMIANGSFQSKSDSSALDRYHKHLFGELGAGYYTKLGDRARFECFGGYGLGQAETGYDYTFFTHNSGVVKGMYERYFIQTDFGISSTFDVVTSGISLKGSYVNFFKFSSGLEEIHESRSNMYFEPAVFIRVGWKYIKFQFQFGGSILTNENPAFNHQPFMLSGGLVFNIPLILAK
jgi:hypothetical protein